MNKCFTCVKNKPDCPSRHTIPVYMCRDFLPAPASTVLPGEGIMRKSIHTKILPIIAGLCLGSLLGLTTEVVWLRFVFGIPAFFAGYLLFRKWGKIIS